MELQIDAEAYPNQCQHWYRKMMGITKINVFPTCKICKFIVRVITMKVLLVRLNARTEKHQTHIKTNVNIDDKSMHNLCSKK